MNLYDQATLDYIASLDEETIEFMKQQFRENLTHIEDINGYGVYTQPSLTANADYMDLPTGFATAFDLKGDGVLVPMIIVGEVALESKYYQAIVQHEMGHIVSGHLDGRTGSERHEHEELEADAYSFAQGTNILEWLTEAKQIVAKSHQDFPLDVDMKWRPSVMSVEEYKQRLDEEQARRDYAINEFDIRIAAIEALKANQ